MKKFLSLLLVLILTAGSSFAYSVKVYDEFGNRVGTYRKEGDRFVLYDFNDNKIEEPEELIEDAPPQKTLTQYTQYLYNENMVPIATYRSGYWGSNGRYYPRGFMYPRGWMPTASPCIVRPNAKPSILNDKDYYEKNGRKGSTNVIVQP